MADLAISHGGNDPEADPRKRADQAWGPWSTRSSQCVYENDMPSAAVKSSDNKLAEKSPTDENNKGLTKDGLKKGGGVVGEVIRTSSINEYTAGNEARIN